MKKFIMPQNHKYLGHSLQHLLDMYLRKEKGLTNERIHGVDNGIHEDSKTL